MYYFISGEGINTCEYLKFESENWEEFLIYVRNNIFDTLFYLNNK